MENGELMAPSMMDHILVVVDVVVVVVVVVDCDSIDHRVDWYVVPDIQL
jgi:hypothetical protein